MYPKRQLGLLIGCVAACAVLACAVLAQSPSSLQITQAPVVDSITYSTARVTWYTSAPGSTYIRYGTDDLNLRTDRTSGGLRTVHSFFLSGLAPSTEYRYRACTAAADKSETCSDIGTLTTGAASSPRPLLPEPPRRLVDVTMPSGFGDPFVIDSQCSNLDSVLKQLATLEGEQNYELTIPAGTSCEGPVIFPNRPKHTGWIVVRSTGALPPAGTRVDASTLPQMARFVSVAIPEGTRLSLAGLPSPCSPGNLVWASDVPGLGLFICSPQGPSGGTRKINNAYIGGGSVVVTLGSHGYRTGNIVRVTGTGMGIDNASFRITVIDEHNFLLDGARGRGTYSDNGTVTRNDNWTLVDAQSGPDLPSECTMNQWFYKTPAAGFSAYWCTAPNTWGLRRAVAGAEMEAIQFQDNARGYRFVGIEVTHAPVPDPFPEGWDQPNYSQGYYAGLVYTKVNNDSILFDRCDIHGQDYPGRLARGVSLYGSNVGIIDSRVYNVNRWTEKAAAGAFRESIAIAIVGPGPGLIENNFLEAIGMTVYFPDVSRNSLPPTDYVIRRNYFSHSERYLYGSPLNVSRKNYMNRQLIEFKAAQRVLVEGNVFDGNWNDVTQGAMVLLTPRSTAAAAVKAIDRIEDGTVILASRPTTNLADPYSPEQLVLITKAGAYNGVWTVDAVKDATSFTLRGAPAGTVTGGVVDSASSFMQISDIDVRNNVFRRGPHLMLVAGHDSPSGNLMTRTTQRVRAHNNLVYDINARRYSQGGYMSPLSTSEPSGRSGIAFSVDSGAEDLIITNNTIYDVKGNAPHFLFTDASTMGRNAGLEMRDNVVTGDKLTLHSVSNQVVGADSLNREFVTGSKPAWTVTNNVVCCTLTGAAKTPAGNFMPSSPAEIGWLDPDGWAFQLKSSSPYRGAGTAGGDPGVNMADLEAALGQPVAMLLKSSTARNRRMNPRAAVVAEQGRSDARAVNQGR